MAKRPFYYVEGQVRLTSPTQKLLAGCKTSVALPLLLALPYTTREGKSYYKTLPHNGHGIHYWKTYAR